MFRKRKDAGGGQGYDRISQLIEDRQRELALDSSGDDELDEDTILMHGRGAPADEAEPEDMAVSLINLRGPRAPHLDQPESADLYAHAAVTLPLASPPPAASEPEAEPPAFEAESEEYRPAPPFDTPSAPNWETPRSRPETPPMRVPDLRGMSAAGTLVAADAVWDGKLRSEGDIRIEGIVRGEITTAGTLVVAPEAQVHGTIHARNLLIGGDVEGDVTCDERLEILPGGSARGQINSGTLVVHEGAYIDSRFQMRHDPGHAEQEAPR